MDESIQNEFSGDAALIVIRSLPVMSRLYQGLRNRNDCE